MSSIIGHRRYGRETYPSAPRAGSGPTGPTGPSGETNLTLSANGVPLTSRPVVDFVNVGTGDTSSPDETFVTPVPGNLLVTAAETGVLTQETRIAEVQTFSGACTVQMPDSTQPYVFIGIDVTVFDGDGNAGTNPIAVTKVDGTQLEDPANPNSFAPTATLTGNSVSATWRLTAAQKWKCVAYFPGA